MFVVGMMIIPMLLIYVWKYCFAECWILIHQNIKANIAQKLMALIVTRWTFLCCWHTFVHFGDSLFCLVLLTQHCCIDIKLSNCCLKIHELDQMIAKKYEFCSIIKDCINSPISHHLRWWQWWWRWRPHVNSPVPLVRDPCNWDLLASHPATATLQTACLPQFADNAMKALWQLGLIYGCPVSKALPAARN